MVVPWRVYSEVYVCSEVCAEVAIVNLSQWSSAYIRMHVVFPVGRMWVCSYYLETVHGRLVVHRYCAMADYWRSHLLRVHIACLMTVKLIVHGIHTCAHTHTHTDTKIHNTGTHTHEYADRQIHLHTHTNIHIIHMYLHIHTYTFFSQSLFANRFYYIQ